MRNNNLRNNDKTKTERTEFDKINLRYGHIHYRIIVAVVEIIRDHGGHVSWPEVAAKTGITLRTIQTHFKSTDPRTALRDEILKMLDNVDTWLDAHDELNNRKSPMYNDIMITVLFSIMDRGSEFFSVACDDHRHDGVIYRVAERLFNHLNFDWLPHGIPAPDAKTDRGRMCIRMMQEVILKWGQVTGCDKRQTEPYIARMQRIIRLAEDNKLP